MKEFFWTRININLNNKHIKYEISLTGGQKENGSTLLVFLNMGAAPSSGGQILHRAETINLRNLEWNGISRILCVFLTV